MVRRKGKVPFEIEPTIRFFERSGLGLPWQLRGEFKELIGSEIPADIAEGFARQTFAKGLWVKPIAYITNKGRLRFDPPGKARG